MVGILHFVCQSCLIESQVFSELVKRLILHETVTLTVPILTNCKENLVLAFMEVTEINFSSPLNKYLSCQSAIINRNDFDDWVFPARVVDC